MTWWERLAARRAPDFVIGGAERPYMLRWFLVPRNPVCNVYLHHFLRSDDDPALHDHPWISVSRTLHGYYYEWRFITPHRGARGGFKRLYRGAGGWVWRGARQAHRIELPDGRPCWTLFITGPRVRAWGFHCARGWVPWQVFTAAHNKGAVGRGCD